MLTRVTGLNLHRNSNALFGIAVLLFAITCRSSLAREPASPSYTSPVNGIASTEFDDTEPDVYENSGTPATIEPYSNRQWFSNWFHRPYQDPGPKTLLTWNGAATDEHEPDPKLVTDRPHFSEAASLVGLGRVQIETGYTIFSDRSNGVRTTTQSFGEPLLRAGIGADWFEFRLASTVLTETVSNGNSHSTTGVDDIYIGAKLAIAEQAGIFPEFAIFPQMRLPTGSPAFTSDRVLPGVNLAYAWMLNDWLELECNTQFNSRRDDADHTYTEMIQTANMEYELSDRVGAFTEVIGFFPSGSLTALPEYYFHAGFVFFPSDNVQFDIHSGVGLNSSASNLAFTGVGLSWRY